jgi:hypothetical protein
MFRGNTSYGRLYEGRGSSGSSGAGILLLMMMMMMLLVVIVAVFFLILYRQRRKRQGGTRRRMSKEERQKVLDNEVQKHSDSIYDNASNVGINKDDVEKILLDTDKNLCLTQPDEHGKCNPAFYELRDGCCKLRSTAKADAAKAQTALMKDMGLKLGVMMLTDVFITSLLPKMGARIAGMSSRALAHATRRVATMTAGKMTLMAANFAGKLLMKLGSGPVGWALLVFDIISVTLDLADLRNYDSFIENKGLMESRDILIYKFQEALKTSGADYPMLFPYSSLFPDEAQLASEEMMAHMIEKYTDELLEIEGGVDYFAELIIQAFSGGEDEPVTETPESEEKGAKIMDTWLKNVRKKHAKELDTYVFNILQDEIPEDRKNDIELVTSMSSEATIGINVTEQAAKRWNEENKTEWFKYLDPFYPVAAPEKDWIPPYAAVYTDEYMKLSETNPGTENNPNLVKVKLPKKVTLCYPFGPLVSNCEKPRTSAKHKEPVDPRQFGVKFNYKTGVCEYTRDYCDRYVIDYKTRTWRDGTPYADCELTKDQEWAELFLGTNVVRNAKRYYEDPSNAIDDLGQLYKDRKAEYGTAGALALSIIDPLGMTENTRGMIEGFKEGLAGKDKFCRTGDTCKSFTARHDGGNFMTWSARNADGEIYPHPILFQGQVKVGEDHQFYVPEGGYFRVKCDPGEGGNFTYDEIPADGRKDFTCWLGKLNKDPDDAVLDSIVETAEAGIDFAKDTGEAVIDKAIDVVTDPGGALKDFGNKFVDTVTDPGGALKDVGNDIGKVFGGL